ncbi:hypothetical protein ACE3MZ_18330 [Paenibacillus sp. WLX1005]|uniref:hypothetical protein n=1 Tax=unclassified Paenibacillus TaxID=185978 RepID=UPI0039841E83
MSDEVNRIHRIPFRKISSMLHIKQKIVNVYPDHASKMVVVETEKLSRKMDTVVIEVKNNYLDIVTLTAAEYNQRPSELYVADKLKSLLDEAERDALLHSLQSTIRHTEIQLDRQTSSPDEHEQAEQFLTHARRALSKLTERL